VKSAVKSEAKAESKPEAIETELKKPEVNIGMVGHVDHGKTTLVRSLSGVWTDQHSEEIKRGISIRLGYADATFRQMPQLPRTRCLHCEECCPHCGTKSEVLRTVSFVDSPGHETLMATMLCGAAIMDGAVLVISANRALSPPAPDQRAPHGSEHYGDRPNATSR